jgi:hypothetical protein
MYDVRVYNVQSLNNTIAHTAGDIVWAFGAVAVGGPEKTTDGFYTNTKWSPKIKLTKVNNASATSGTVSLTTKSTHWTETTTNSGDATALSTYPSVVFIHATGKFTSIIGTFTVATAADSTLFQTNGPIWAAQMRSFSQSTALMLYGFRW